MMNRAEYFKKIKRIVVKVGTSLLADPKQGANQAFVEKIRAEIQALRAEGREVVLVTSGAIGLGMHRLKLSARPKDIPGKQATAAVGQALLMNLYERAFNLTGTPVAQVLLTRADLEDHQRYLNARNTMEKLLEMRVVPIINENDTVAVDEIKFGENDNLAALVANLCQADLLVILTDMEGLFDKDPRAHPGARLVGVVAKITPAIMASAGGEGTLTGTGGMVTKLQAAKTVTASGEIMVIADGRKPDVLRKILEGKDEGTLFTAARDRMDSHRRWIAFTLKPKGTLVLDLGAVQAIRHKGKSLLPSGLVRVSGQFEAGEVVRLLGPDDGELGRGLCNYSALECKALKGAKTSEIEARLGYKIKDELVHRDDMVLNSAEE